MLNNYSFETSDGFILAVKFHHVEKANLVMNVAEEHLVMFTASASPAPPLYDLPEPDPTETGQDSYQFASDLQYMVLGAIFGMIGTILYWRFAKA